MGVKKEQIKGTPCCPLDSKKDSSCPFNNVHQVIRFGEYTCIKNKNIIN